MTRTAARLPGEGRGPDGEVVVTGAAAVTSVSQLGPGLRRGGRRGALLLALLLAACVGRPHPIGAYPGAYDETGLATWYGAAFAGRPTASGERFDPAALTVAHRTLPFGTLVEVTALDTGRAIVARVTDRGPVRRDRIIDLSQGAARLLGVGDLARVRVQTARPGTRVGLLAGGMTPER